MLGFWVGVDVPVDGDVDVACRQLLILLRSQPDPAAEEISCTKPEQLQTESVRRSQRIVRG